MFTLRWDGGAFDDPEVQQLLSDREALGVSDHVVVYDGEPRRVLVVTYREPPAPRGGVSGDALFVLALHDRTG